MNTAPLPYPNVLVIAANGKTGRRVVPLLEARGVTVRRGSRSSSPAFDWGQRETWAPALRGMDAAYVVYLPDLAVPSAADDIQAFVEIAKREGVRKLVLLSGRGVPEVRAAEEIVINSGLEWTFVRAAWFNQNFTDGDFAQMVQSGVIALPMGDTVEPILDADDIAEVVTVALTETRLNGEALDLTGPESLSHDDIAHALSQATGRTIRYESITDDAFRAGLTEMDVPSSYIDLLGYLFEFTRSGVNAAPTDDVERALGRPPRSFTAFATAAAAAGDFAAPEVTGA